MNDEQKLTGSSFIITRFIPHPSSLLRASAVIYVLHALLIVKIALAELTAFGAIFLLGWAIARKEARFSFHILYFPLFVYGLASTVSTIFADKRVHPDLEG